MKKNKAKAKALKAKQAHIRHTQVLENLSYIRHELESTRGAIMVHSNRQHENLKASAQERGPQQAALMQEIKWLHTDVTAYLKATYEQQRLIANSMSQTAACMREIADRMMGTRCGCDK